MKLIICFVVCLCVFLGFIQETDGFRMTPVVFGKSRALQVDDRHARRVFDSSLFSTLQRKRSGSKSDGDRMRSNEGLSKQDMKLGVLFLNLGGPETTKDVEGFLYNLFADPDIIRLPSFLSMLQKPLAYFIAKRRAPKSSEAYKSIGGGSPIVKYTQAQSDLVEEKLRNRGYKDAKCYFAMRYWKPYTEDVLEKMKADGVNTMVIVPLYPQFSISTSGSSLRLLQDIFYKTPQEWGEDKIVHTVVPAWYHRPGYLMVMAKLIIDQIKDFPIENMQDGLHVLFSAHGVPQSYIEAGDPYQRQIEECVELISKEVQHQLLQASPLPQAVASKLAGHRNLEINESDDVITKVEKMFASQDSQEMKFSEAESKVKPVEFHLSFQSRVGPVKWLQPYTEETLHLLGKQGVKNLIVVPVSFVSEHIETLEEIDMEYKEIAHESGIVNWKRVPALNTDPMFIEDMANLVEEALEAPVLSVAEAASNSYSDILDSATLSTIDSRSSQRKKSM